MAIIQMAEFIVSSMWTVPYTLWDMLTIKGHESKPAFIIHSHSFCCAPYMFVGSTAYELMNSYQLCDGVLTLSECDKDLPVHFLPTQNISLIRLCFLQKSCRTVYMKKIRLSGGKNFSREKTVECCLYDELCCESDF